MKIEVTALVDQTKYKIIKPVLYNWWLGKLTLMKYKESFYWAVSQPAIWSGYEEKPTQIIINAFLERSKTTLFINIEKIDDGEYFNNPIFKFQPTHHSQLRAQAP